MHPRRSSSVQCGPFVARNPRERLSPCGADGKRCGNGCSQPHIADIGFVGGMIRHEGERVEGYDVFLGGNLEGIAKSRLSRKTGVKVPATGLVSYVGKLIEDYKADNLGQKTFKDYLAVLEPAGATEDSE